MKNNKKRNLLLSLILAAVCLAFLLYVDKFQHYSMLATVLKKGAVYSLVAVSMNLLNGFTGLFSLGQAGFMLVGAYAFAAINIIAFAAMGIDKAKARAGKWRIAEGTLFALAALGGALGGTLGMRVFHHKTKHKEFRFGFPALLCLQCAAVVYLILIWKQVL